jgi:predicted CxxxxCH...CXXCH cytochrome family protein
MRSSAILFISAFLLLGLDACDARPAAPGGDPNPETGAHTIHLTGTTLAKPIACEQCHNAQFQVTLAGDLAAANGAQGTFNPTTKTCSNVYCHDGGPQLEIGGGTVPVPVWNPPSTIVCGGCHALPGGETPTPWHPLVATNVECGLCHLGYSRTSVVVDTHVNGVVNVRFDIDTDYCAACHGEATRKLPAGTPTVVQAAPPVDRSGSSDTSRVGVGAHQSHLLPGAGAISSPIACQECHVVPTDLEHVGPTSTTPASLAWGPLASSGSAAPSYDVASATCTNYCHGQTLNGGGTLTRPVWTQVDGTQAACGTCHASPPSDTSHYLHASGKVLLIACSFCHPPGYTADAVNREAAPLHVNGVKNMNPGNYGDWNPAATNPNGWTGTATGCHGGTRYWTESVPSAGGCY